MIFRRSSSVPVESRGQHAALLGPAPVGGGHRAGLQAAAAGRTRLAGHEEDHPELRPVYHRLEERIRAHVLLCWLALLLVRIIETTTGDTWNRVREDLQELHIGTFEGPAGTFRQRTELTTAPPRRPRPGTRLGHPRRGSRGRRQRRPAARRRTRRGHPDRHRRLDRGPLARADRAAAHPHPPRHRRDRVVPASL